MRIALDIDDVLAGFVPAVHETFKAELIPHDHWSPYEKSGELILAFDEQGTPVGLNEQYSELCEYNKDFWYGLQPISLPCDIPEGTVCYITSSPKEMVDVRIEWLKKHGFPTLPVIHSKEKHLTMDTLGIGLLIDDKLETVQKVREYGFSAMHFSPWYTTQELLIDDWCYSVGCLMQASSLLKNASEFTTEKGRFQFIQMYTS